MAAGSLRHARTGGPILRFCTPAALAALLALGSHATVAESSLTAALARYAEVAPQPLPSPDERQLAALAAGETVSLRRDIDVTDSGGDSSQRVLVIGYQWVQRPRLLVWLATLDVNTRHSAALTEHLLSVDQQGGAEWYQHMDLPWPMRNRHWMIRSRKNIEVAMATDDAIWEHQWRLADRGPARSLELLASGTVPELTARDAKRAIYLSFNRGAWTMIDLGDGTTLVITHALAVMGGWIPEDWVASFVSRQLRHVLQNLSGRADTIHADYTAQPPVFSGSGVPIDRGLALAAWRDYSSDVAPSAAPAPGARSATETQP